MEDITLGTVLPPAEDVSELGGPSGHDACRWRVETPDGTVLGCHRTAGHHVRKRDAARAHWDVDTELFWDHLGRIWLEV